MYWLPSIAITSQEEITGLWRLTVRLENVEKIIELPSDAANDSDGVR